MGLLALLARTARKDVVPVGLPYDAVRARGGLRLFGPDHRLDACPGLAGVLQRQARPLGVAGLEHVANDDEELAGFRAGAERPDEHPAGLRGRLVIGSFSGIALGSQQGVGRVEDGHHAVVDLAHRLGTLHQRPDRHRQALQGRVPGRHREVQPAVAGLGLRRPVANRHFIEVEVLGPEDLGAEQGLRGPGGDVLERVRGRLHGAGSAFGVRRLEHELLDLRPGPVGQPGRNLKRERLIGHVGPAGPKPAVQPQLGINVGDVAIEHRLPGDLGPAVLSAQHDRQIGRPDPHGGRLARGRLDRLGQGRMVTVAAHRVILPACTPRIACVLSRLVGWGGDGEPPPPHIRSLASRGS